LASLPLRFVFDLVDPGSYLVDALLERWGSEGRILPSVEWLPLELRPFPGPALDPAEPGWASMTEALEEAARQLGIPFHRPLDLPRTRKAHESILHAENLGLGSALRKRLFRAHFVEGRDIGRVDVVVELAAALGLDPGELRTVLGVDRYLPQMLELRAASRSARVRGVPTLLWGETRWEGFRGEEDLQQFLERDPDSGTAGVRRDEPREEI
jgi:predicted DsbA family dithiol-disulfide isomerase